MPHHQPMPRHQSMPRHRSATSWELRNPSMDITSIIIKTILPTPGHYLPTMLARYFLGNLCNSSVILTDNPWCPSHYLSGMVAPQFNGNKQYQQVFRMWKNKQRLRRVMYIFQSILSTRYPPPNPYLYPRYQFLTQHHGLQ